MSDTATDVYYDPYDHSIDNDPYPTWRRMRDEVPLYYNDRYDFFALTRFDDVEKGLVDWKTFISGKGSVLEMIKAFREASGRDIPYSFAPRRPGDVPQSWTDPTLAHAVLGWRAQRGIDEICGDMWRWVQNQTAREQRKT